MPRRTEVYFAAVIQQNEILIRFDATRIGLDPRGVLGNAIDLSLFEFIGCFQSCTSQCPTRLIDMRLAAETCSHQLSPA